MPSAYAACRQAAASRRTLALLRNTQYRTTVLGYAAYTFALGALAFWFPDFLVSFHGMPQAKADYLVGLIAVGTGFAGTFAGGWIGDYVLRYTRHAYLLVSGIATLLAAPFCVLALTAHEPRYFLTGLIVAELLMFASTGPDQFRDRQLRRTDAAGHRDGVQHPADAPAGRRAVAVHRRRDLQGGSCRRNGRRRRAAARHADPAGRDPGERGDLDDGRTAEEEPETT